MLLDFANSLVKFEFRLKCAQVGVEWLIALVIISNFRNLFFKLKAKRNGPCLNLSGS